MLQYLPSTLLCWTKGACDYWLSSQNNHSRRCSGHHGFSLCLSLTSGPGDGFFSSAFQSRLIGNNLHNASMPECESQTHVWIKPHGAAAVFTKTLIRRCEEVKKKCRHSFSIDDRQMGRSTGFIKLHSRVLLLRLTVLFYAQFYYSLVSFFMMFKKRFPFESSVFYGCGPLDTLLFSWCRSGLWLHHYCEKSPYCRRLFALSLALISRRSRSTAAAGQATGSTHPQVCLFMLIPLMILFIWIKRFFWLFSLRWQPISIRTTTICGWFSDRMIMSVRGGWFIV